MLGWVFGDVVTSIFGQLPKPTDYGEPFTSDEKPHKYEYYTARRLVHNGQFDEENMALFRKKWHPQHRDVDSFRGGYERRPAVLKSITDLEWSGKLIRFSPKKTD